MAAFFMRQQSHAKSLHALKPFCMIAAAATAATEDVLLVLLAVPPILFSFVVPSPWVARAKSGATPSAKA